MNRGLFRGSREEGDLEKPGNAIWAGVPAGFGFGSNDYTKDMLMFPGCPSRIEQGMSTSGLPGRMLGWWMRLDEPLIFNGFYCECTTTNVGGYLNPNLVLCDRRTARPSKIIARGPTFDFSVLGVKSAIGYNTLCHPGYYLLTAHQNGITARVLSSHISPIGFIQPTLGASATLIGVAWDGSLPALGSVPDPPRFDSAWNSPPCVFPSWRFP